MALGVIQCCALVTDVSSYTGERSLLHLAAEHNSSLVLEELLRKGLALEGKERGLTPLLVAASSGATDVGRVLLRLGAERKVFTLEGETPLHRAALQGNEELCKVLLQDGNDGLVNIQDSKKRTALHRAVEGGHAGLIKYLVHGKRELTDGEGNTALSLAIAGNKASCVKALIEAGCERSIEIGFSGLDPVSYAASG